jgi:hypothetical protein
VRFASIFRDPEETIFHSVAGSGVELPMEACCTRPGAARWASIFRHISISSKVCSPSNLFNSFDIVSLGNVCANRRGVFLQLIRLRSLSCVGKSLGRIIEAAVCIKKLKLSRAE